MNLQNIFSIPIYTHTVPQYIADKMEEITTPKLSQLTLYDNVYTDYGNSNPLISPQEILPFLNYINKITLEYSKESNLYKGKNIQYWVQDYKKDHDHTLHCHPQSTIAGTYYIRSNQNAGKLSFSNPNSNLISTTRSNNDSDRHAEEFYNIKPKRGLLVLFPPWLLHKVIPSYEENCIRTSFSFNYGL